MSKAKRLRDRLNSPGIEKVIRYDGPNGRFTDYVEINTRESVAFRLEFPDGTVQTYLRPKPFRPLTERRNRVSVK